MLLTQEQLKKEGDRIAYQNEQIRNISEGSADLWKLRKIKPFEKYYEWLRAPDGAKIVCVGNNKGGVGKTMLSANLAAYISEYLKKNVLVIDLDHQGSASSILLLAANNPDVESRVERLFEPDASLATLSEIRVHLAGKLNRGWLVPSNYTFASRENQLLFKYVIDDSSDLDLRFRLAHTLLHPHVRRDYDVIIIDMPPRLSLGSVNALFASHYLVVPSMLDKLSAEAVNRFVRQVLDIKREFSLDVDLAGIVGMMTRERNMSKAEKQIWADVCLQATWWREDIDYGLGTVPRRVDIANAVGEDVPYLLPGAKGTAVKADFDPTFHRICERIGLLR